MLTKLLLVLILIQFSVGKINEDTVDSYRILLEKTYSGSKQVELLFGKNKEDVGEPLILTPYIKKKKLKEAREAARVDPIHFLPGVESYSGYLTVNQNFNSNLWFWYFPVMNKSLETTPWIIWLQGGPGAPSTYGLFYEVGPFSVTDDNKILEREHAWTRNYSMLFIDNPVGTGFSFTNDAGYATNQTTIGENLYEMLQQFLTIFPELRVAPLFIAGESYAGKHVPSLGIQIHWNRHKDERINLQGLAMGNGFTDPATLMKFSYVAREVGLLDDKTADSLKQIEALVVKHIQEGELYKAFSAYSKGLFIKQIANLPSPYNYLKDEDESFFSYFNFLEQPKIRRALHVGNTTLSAIGVVYDKLIPDFLNSAKIWVEELLTAYRVMFYNGHLDTVVAYHPSVNTYNSLSFPDAEKYKTTRRKTWMHENILAGYYKQAGNLLDVMVRGAGHMVPIDKPAEAHALISAFIQNIPLSLPDN